MRGNDPMAIPRIEYIDPTKFDDMQINIGLTDPKNGFPVSAVADGRQGPNVRYFGTGELGKRHFLNLSHSSVLNETISSFDTSLRREKHSTLLGRSRRFDFERWHVEHAGYHTRDGKMMLDDRR
jgi:hypothetical protein